MAAKFTRLTHKIAIQMHLVAESCTILQFSLQAASPETFGYTLIYLKKTYRGKNAQSFWNILKDTDFFYTASNL
jgi:hypothetical protein